MHYTFCLPTKLGDLYRFQEKSSKLSMDNM